MIESMILAVCLFGAASAGVIAFLAFVIELALTNEGDE